MQGITSVTREQNAPSTGDFDWRLVSWWVLARIAAYSLSLLLGLVKPSAGLALGLLSLVVIVVTPGLAQWLVLRKYLQRMSWGEWVYADIIGASAGAAYLIVAILILLFVFGGLFHIASIPELMTSPLLLPIILLQIGLAIGAGAGLLKWKVLTKYLPSDVLRFKWLWVLANAFAGFIGFVSLIPNGPWTKGSGGTFVNSILGALAVTAGSLITGMVLTRLLSETISPVTDLMPGASQQTIHYRRVYRVRRKR